MILFRLPRRLAFFNRTVTMDGASYVLSFQWNSRGGWFMGLTDSAGTVLFYPRRVVVDIDLLSSHRHLEACPPGVLMAYDFSRTGAPVGYLDFVSTEAGATKDGRVALLYIPESEL